VQFFVNVNPAINTARTFTHSRIEYRGLSTAVIGASNSRAPL
jgi:hypothetical protein